MNNITPGSEPASALDVLKVILRHGRIDAYVLFGLLAVAFADDPARCALAFALAMGTLVGTHRRG